MWCVPKARSWDITALPPDRSPAPRCPAGSGATCPIPVMILGRLAIDQTWQGRKLGQSLLNDAIRRTLAVADVASIRAILVHAISAEAKRFYERYGFQECPEKPMTLVLMLRDTRAAL